MEKENKRNKRDKKGNGVAENYSNSIMVIKGPVLIV